MFLRRLLPLALAGALALAACGSDDAATPATTVAATTTAATTATTAGSAAPASTPTAGSTQQFTDSTGRTVTIPARPERIVSLHEFSSGVALLSLDAPVVGMVERDGKFDSSVSRFGLDGVAPVGNINEPDIEAIAALDPDLIVGLAFDGKPTFSDTSAAEQLEAIAPTVFISQNRTVDEVMADIATITGMATEVAAQQADYESARTAFLTEHADLAGKLSIAEVGWFDPTFYLMQSGHPSPYARLAADLGLLFPPCAAGGDTSWCELSAETMTQANADLLLYSDDTGDPTELPLWVTMAGVKAGKAVKLDDFPAANAYITYADVIAAFGPLLDAADPTVFDESTW